MPLGSMLRREAAKDNGKGGGQGSRFLGAGGGESKDSQKSHTHVLELTRKFVK